MVGGLKGAHIVYNPRNGDKVRAIIDGVSHLGKMALSAGFAIVCIYEYLRYWHGHCFLAAN
jgi:hypothetical protein